MRIYRNYSLLRHNTFGIDVNAMEYAEYRTESELCNFIKELSPDIKLLAIGRGSNLLFTENYKGVVLHSNIIEIKVLSEDADSVLVQVGSGVLWDDFVAYSIHCGWYGAENLSLIPGEVGASAVQNIGAYGVEVKDIIESVEFIERWTGEKRIYKNEECEYAYRNSVFKSSKQGEYIVTFVNFRLKKSFTPKVGYGSLASHFDGGIELVTAEQMRNKIIQIRQEKLPDYKQWGNAGSFFKNPIVSEDKFEQLYAVYPQMPYYKVKQGYKIPAGWLIEQTGWKGRDLGPAGVYEKQALILVNRGGATGNDIITLKNKVRADVKAKFGLDIYPEVQFV